MVKAEGSKTESFERSALALPLVPFLCSESPEVLFLLSCRKALPLALHLPFSPCHRQWAGHSALKLVSGIFGNFFSSFLSRIGPHPSLLCWSFFSCPDWNYYKSFRIWTWGRNSLKSTEHPLYSTLSCWGAAFLFLCPLSKAVLSVLHIHRAPWLQLCPLPSQAWLLPPKITCCWN